MKHSRNISRWAAASLLVAICAAPAIHAADKAPATPPAATAKAEPKAKIQIDPKADELLKKMSEAFKNSKSMRVNMKTLMSMKLGGMNQEMPADYKFVAERPNKMSMTMQGEGMGVNVISDGKKLVVHVPMMNRYTEADAPAKIEDVGESSGAPSGPHEILTSGLFSDNPYETLIKDAKKIAYVGMGKDAEKDLHHLRVTQDDVEWDMYLSNDAKPTISKIRADMTKAMAEGVPEEARAGVSMVMTLTYSNWDLAAKTTADDFKFTPPAGAEKVEEIVPQAKADDDEEEENAPSPLIGKPAPKLDVPLLNGGEASLAKHKGKDVVILDFWATWCGPCVRAMPIISEVVSSYKDKGVVLYAVNVQEQPKAITEFLEKRKLNVTVALDKDGAVSERYGVEGIPQTVIIDKEGVIRSVHVGFSPELKDILKKDIDPLLK
ncbi:MAG TPA: DUF2092 domain-containing protein [Methylomirabilota bacterium]|nr:DUF2092 domain-containing protein [Methylomirabilota bacterium]